MIADHPLAVSAVSTAILRTACTQIFKFGIIAIACQFVADRYAERVKSALTAASRQHACLRTTLPLPDLAKTPLTFTPDNSSRCPN